MNQHSSVYAMQTKCSETFILQPTTLLATYLLWFYNFGTNHSLYTTKKKDIATI